MSTTTNNSSARSSPRPADGDKPVTVGAQATASLVRKFKSASMDMENELKHDMAGNLELQMVLKQTVKEYRQAENVAKKSGMTFSELMESSRKKAKWMMMTMM